VRYKESKGKKLFNKLIAMAGKVGLVKIGHWDGWY
jgi:hypothetical protein